MMPDVVTAMNESNEMEEEFRNKLLDAFLSSDIPVYKLLNPKLRSSFQSSTSNKILYPRTLRRNIEAIYQEKIEKIVKKVENYDVFY